MSISFDSLTEEFRYFFGNILFFGSFWLLVVFFVGLLGDSTDDLLVFFMLADPEKLLIELCKYFH